MKAFYMGCRLIGARFCLDPNVTSFSWRSKQLCWEDIYKIEYTLATFSLKKSTERSVHQWQLSIANQGIRHKAWRTFSNPLSMEENISSEEDASKDSPEETIAKPLNTDGLKVLLADSQRTKLIKKLSEANQQNRFLIRQLHVKEDALVNFKRELAVMELEIQGLVALAEEIAKSGIPGSSRKINGKYVQSHLLARLEALHEKLKEQLKGVDAVQSKEVPLFWCGMAESVQVMGTFDGWTQGEHLSPEYTGSFTKFSTTLMLRPGRYEIKFLVDGEWQLSSEFPIVGDGLMKNNLLIVE